MIGGAGGWFAFFPETLLLTEDHYALMLGRLFGAACLSQAFLSGLIVSFKNYIHARQIGLISLTIFHAGVTIIQTMAWVEKLFPLALAIIHLIWMSLFVALIIKLRQKTN